jgi:phosphohistidine swiveling domain-containing protein
VLFATAVHLAAAIVMDNSFVSLPAALDAFTVKVDVPAVVGVPEITPVVPARLKPAGNVVPPSRLHVGAVPVATRVWLYGVCTSPFANASVVIAGATGAGAIVMDKALVAFPAALVALTVKVDIPCVVGVPEITPVVPARSKPTGNVVPPSRLHVMGASPVAVSVWLYAVSAVPPVNVVVVIVGAVPPPLGLPPSSSSEQAVIVNPITATRAIIPNNLIVFCIQSSSHNKML